jgi:hypothetical protein
MNSLVRYFITLLFAVLLHLLQVSLVVTTSPASVAGHDTGPDTAEEDSNLSDKAEVLYCGLEEARRNPNTIGC